MGKRYFQILRAKLFNSKRSFANMCSSNWKKNIKNISGKIGVKGFIFWFKKAGI